MAAPKRDYGPNPYEPPPDTYVSPHDVYHGGEKPVVTPVFAYVEDENGYQQAFHKGSRYEYPHRAWVEAREQFAKDGTWESLSAMLQHVTETNPPPGTPIPVYKPREPKPDRARTLFFAGFGVLFCLVGLLPLIAMLFG
jgi:hypothetical protein